MRSPQTKIAEARAATAAAVDVIRDGVAFAVIAGTDEAQPVFPHDGSLAVADAATRQYAKQAVAGLLPRGGTAIGQWLRLAHSMFTAYDASLRHAILLTDGRNEHETPEQLAAAISLCEGRVQLRLPGRRHRLGGGGAPPDLLGAARHRRHRARSGRARRRLRRHDGNGHGQAGRRRVAAGVDAAARDASGS